MYDQTRVTPEQRDEFLDSIIVTFIESGSMAWFWVETYRRMEGGPLYAEITEKESGERFTVDHDTVTRGLDVARYAVLREVPPDGPVLHNATTGQRLFMSEHNRRRILEAENNPAGDYDGTWAGDLDALDAYAIVECGLFGAVTYG